MSLPPRLISIARRRLEELMKNLPPPHPPNSPAGTAAATEAAVGAHEQEYEEWGKKFVAELENFDSLGAPRDEDIIGWVSQASQIFSPFTSTRHRSWLSWGSVLMPGLVTAVEEERKELEDERRKKRKKDEEERDDEERRAIERAKREREMFDEWVAGKISKEELLAFFADEDRVEQEEEERQSVARTVAVEMGREMSVDRSDEPPVLPPRSVERDELMDVDSKLNNKEGAKRSTPAVNDADCTPKPATPAGSEPDSSQAALPFASLSKKRDWSSLLQSNPPTPFIRGVSKCVRCSRFKNPPPCEWDSPSATTCRKCIRDKHRCYLTEEDERESKRKRGVELKAGKAARNKSGAAKGKTHTPKVKKEKEPEVKIETTKAKSLNLRIKGQGTNSTPTTTGTNGPSPAGYPVVMIPPARPVASGHGAWGTVPVFKRLLIPPPAMRESQSQANSAATATDSGNQGSAASATKTAALNSVTVHHPDNKDSGVLVLPKPGPLSNLTFRLRDSDRLGSKRNSVQAEDTANNNTATNGNNSTSANQTTTSTAGEKNGTGDNSAKKIDIDAEIPISHTRTPEEDIFDDRKKKFAELKQQQQSVSRASRNSHPPPPPSTAATTSKAAVTTIRIERPRSETGRYTSFVNEIDFEKDDQPGPIDRVARLKHQHSGAMAQLNYVRGSARAVERQKKAIMEVVKEIEDEIREAERG